MEAKEQLVHRTERTLGMFVGGRQKFPGSREGMSEECIASVYLEEVQCKMRDRKRAKLDYSFGLNQLESL